MNRLKTILSAFCVITLITSCNMNTENQNPFFEDYTTLHGTVPFDDIKIEHYEPAFMEGMKQHKAEIDAIVNNPEAPTFANTIEPYEKSGQLLSKASRVFSVLRSAETNDEMQA